jgi:hypothetical protein
MCQIEREEIGTDSKKREIWRKNKLAHAWTRILQSRVSPKIIYEPFVFLNDI